MWACGSEADTGVTQNTHWRNKTNSGMCCAFINWKDKQNKRPNANNCGAKERNHADVFVDHHGSGTRFGKHNRNAWNCKQLSSGDIAQINMKMTWFIHAHSTLWHCVACWRGDVPRFIPLTLNWTLKTTSEKCIQRIALFFKSFRWRESHVRWTEYSSLSAFMQWEFIAAPNHYAKLCDWIEKKIQPKMSHTQIYVALFFPVASFIYKYDFHFHSWNIMQIHL